MQPKLFITQPSDTYKLIDSGGNEKLERFGEIVVSRPDPQALWDKTDPSLWEKARLKYSQEWVGKKNIPSSWEVSFSNMVFTLKPSSFKHIGIFPEQHPNWEWIEKQIISAGRPIEVLNLFGYTGGATLFALRGGAKVTHVDGSKTAISWAKDNASRNNLLDKPVRFILDDTLSFVRREIRRQKKYDVIILDPPSFGRGPEGEVWKIERDLPILINLIKDLLSDEPLSIILNGYAAGYSPYAYYNSLIAIKDVCGGEVEFGELGILETSQGRVLPAGITARLKRTS